MPSFYVHMSVAEHVAELLGTLDEWPRGQSLFGPNALPGPDPRRLADLARSHPNYYALGAVGPDLFFLLPDFRTEGGVPLGNTLVGVADFVNDLTLWVDEWILEWWEPTFGPFSQNVDEATSRLTGDLINKINDALGALVSLNIRAAMTLASVTYDWFGLFSLGHNKGLDNRDFLWSDMLHYRKTGRFGQELWEMANAWESRADPNDLVAVEAARIWAERLRAYALGYITHLATDVTGHPFTNEKSGGPFRTHWQRHKLVENHIDARVYVIEHGDEAQWSEITASALHYRIAFASDGSEVSRPNVPPIRATLRNLYVRRRLLDLDSQLPIEVATLLYEALGATYVDGAIPDHPTQSTPTILGGDRRPTPDAIQDTYALLFRYMKHTMLDGYWHEKPLPPELFPNLEFPVATDPKDDAPSAADDDLDFLDLLLSVIRFCLHVLAVAFWILTLPLGVLLDTATFGPRNVVYYAIELPIYYITLALRQILVMTGYLLPKPDEIAISQTRIGVGSNDLFLTTLEALGDTLTHIDAAQLAGLGQRAEQLASSEGRSPQDVLTELLGELDVALRPPQEPSPDARFPRQHEQHEHLHPWRYPETPAEQAPTTAGPFAPDDDAELLVGSALPGDMAIRSKYERSPDPDSTEAISRKEMNRQANLGDPIHFSTYLIWQLTRTEGLDDSTRLTDWNLDADRGYAWKCWDWNRVGEDGPTFEDSEGNDVQIPCTPPSQFEPMAGFKHDSDTALKVHWADEDDPNCTE